MPILHSSPQMRFQNKITYPEIKIEEGQFTFLVGESGCGKSTYLKMLNRTVLPERGTIVYKGKKIEELSVLSYRREVLLVPQDLFLLDGAIEENFRFYYEARQQPLLPREEMEKFLNICCVSFPLETECKKLSGGERQRVFLAVFLSFMPKVLLLDEPTSALDEQTAAALLGNIKEFCGKDRITVVCVCHSQSLVRQFSDAVIRLG